MKPEEVSRRIRAARALAAPTDDELADRKRPMTGISTAELARRIDQPRLGEKTLGNLERTGGPALKPQLTEIAAACGLPYEFFTIDFATLGEESDLRQQIADIRAELDEKVSGLQTAVEALSANGQSPSRETGSTPRSQPRKTSPPDSR